MSEMLQRALNFFGKIERKKLLNLLLLRSETVAFTMILYQKENGSILVSTRIQESKGDKRILHFFKCIS